MNGWSDFQLVRGELCGRLDNGKLQAVEDYCAFASEERIVELTGIKK